MKILQVNCVYRKGSTGKIVCDIHNELQHKSEESVVCYGRGANITEDNVYKTCGELYSKINNLISRFTGVMYGGCFFSTNKLISVIKKENPDIVHLHCINGYFVNIYRIVKWLKENKIKTVLTLHAEFMYTANCGHALDCERWKNGCGNCPRLKKETKSILLDKTNRSWQKMRNAFKNFDSLKVVAVSEWIASRAKQSTFLADKEISVIYNGIGTECFGGIRDTSIENALKKKYNIPEDKTIILHVTPNFYDPIKGGKYFAELSKILPQQYQSIVIGTANIESDHIISIPFLSDQSELATFYKMADALVITSRCDTYPTVCLEANCCGTPVVGFNVGGVSETIFNNMGETVEFGNIEALLAAVQKWTSLKKEISPNTVQKCIEKNSRVRMSKEYIDLYKELLEDRN